MKRYSYDRQTEQKVTLDAAYFHTGNSGYTIEVYEKRRTWQDSEKEDRDSYTYRCEIGYGAHGVDQDYTWDIPNYAAAEWLSEVFSRLGEKMRKHQNPHNIAGTIAISVVDGKELDKSAEYKVGGPDTYSYARTPWPGPSALPLKDPPKEVADPDEDLAKLFKSMES